MYLMYVDESGDPGPAGTPYFVLSSLVVHDSQWRNFANYMLAFRKTLRATYRLPIRAEIHAKDYIRSPPIPNMPTRDRIAILGDFLDEIARQPYVSITNVLVGKAGKPAGYDVFDVAWRTLFQRFENTLLAGNFPGGHQNDFGLVFTDATSGKKLAKIMRRMNVHNPIPNQPHYGPGYRNMPITRVIEDPHSKDSKDSYFIQAVDVCAYFVTQKYAPNRAIQRHNASQYITKLTPVLNLAARPRHPLGIVEL